ncbi:MAG: hypothetical protein ACRDSH_25050 [Pseudonocardiaceae bacterium]
MVTTASGLTSLTVTFGGACRRGPRFFAVRKLFSTQWVQLCRIVADDMWPGQVSAQVVEFAGFATVDPDVYFGEDEV